MSPARASRAGLRPWLRLGPGTPAGPRRQPGWAAGAPGPARAPWCQDCDSGPESDRRCGRGLLPHGRRPAAGPARPAQSREPGPGDSVSRPGLGACHPTQD
eukprot:768602-Hanusia_phi.AAC.8